MLSYNLQKDLSKTLHERIIQTNDATGLGRRIPAMGLNLIALLWGFSEATFFFIVPDVLLSFIALKSRQKATRICFWTLSGALAGGTIMFTWGALHEASADHFLVQVPAISNHLIQEVDRQVETIGSMATFAGPLTGKPYKVYAVHAGSAELNLAIFLLLSIPARLLRFLLAAWIFSVLSGSLLKGMHQRHKYILLCCFWTAFYCWFFSIM